MNRQVIEELSDMTTHRLPTTPLPGAKLRGLERIVPAERAIEGGGFEVFRPFPTAALDLLDPFLLLDEMARKYTPPGSPPVGAPDHPHRGFETVTYMLAGEAEHRDSAGNQGIIGPGDVQWMTAGDGIVHSEMPSERFQTEGGLSHGLQLWINLPSEAKRAAPRYQALPAAELATAEGAGWHAFVVAGELLGVKGPAESHTPVGYARLTVKPGANLDIDVADGNTAAIYSFAGSSTVGAAADRLDAHHIAIFERSTGAIRVAVDAEAAEPLDAIVLTGKPLNEPIARYGPFVMNTKSEILEAIDDFNAGRMGSIPAIGTL